MAFSKQMSSIRGHTHNPSSIIHVSETKRINVVQCPSAFHDLCLIANIQTESIIHVIECSCAWIEARTSARLAHVQEECRV
jgi:hypothetical protein